MLISFLIIFLAVFALFSIKIYLTLNSTKNKTYVCMVGKTALITGANRGMGYLTAMDFASRGARVILACRDETRAQEAKNNIIMATHNNNIAVILLDLTCFKSIRNAARILLETEKKIDILVNNAAVVRPFVTTKDKFHVTTQTNAYGPFLLNMLLLDLLKLSGNGRIVNLSNVEATLFDDVKESFVDNSDSIVAFATNYFQSKKCLSLLMLELADKLKKTSITVNFSIPRYCKTGLQVYENTPKIVLYFKRYIIMYFFFGLAEESYINTIYVALSNELCGTTGKYYKDGAEYLARNIVDVALRQRTWVDVIKYIQLNENEISVLLQ